MALYVMFVTIILVSYVHTCLISLTLILSTHPSDLSLTPSYCIISIRQFDIHLCIPLKYEYNFVSLHPPQLNLIVARMSSTFQKMNEKSFEQWSMVRHPLQHNDSPYRHTLLIIMTHPIDTPSQS